MKNLGQSIKIDRGEEMPYNVIQRTQRGFVDYTFLDLPKEAAYYLGLRLTEFRITKGQDCWRCMLKGIKGNVPSVAYFFADHYDDALEYTFYEICSRQVNLKPDSYPIIPRNVGQRNYEP